MNIFATTGRTQADKTTTDDPRATRAPTELTNSGWSLAMLILAAVGRAALVLASGHPALARLIVGGRAVSGCAGGCWAVARRAVAGRAVSGLAGGRWVFARLALAGRAVSGLVRPRWVVVGLGAVGCAVGGVAVGGWVLAALGFAGLVLGSVGRLVLGGLRQSVVSRPFWCELGGAALAAVLGWRVTAGLLPWWWLPVPLLLGWFAVPLATADLTCRRLPDALTLPAYPALGAAVAFAAVAGPDPGIGLRALVGVALFGGAHLVVRVVAPAAMGGGDVKLAGSLGAVLGAMGWPAIAVAASIAAGCTLLLAIATRARAAPHGPGLLAATWLLAAFPGIH